MKRFLVGALALFVGPAWAVGLNCGALSNSIGTAPAGYAEQCLGTAAKIASGSWLSSGLTGVLDPAYAIQLSPMTGFAAQGLYGFSLGNFAGAERIGDEETLSSTFGMDFNPAATRLYGVRQLAGTGVPQLAGIIDLDDGTFATTGAFTVLPLIAPRDRVTGLSFHPRTGQAWMLTADVLTNNPELSEVRIWNVNPQGGAVSLIGRLLPEQANPLLIDLAVNCQGDMYAHNITDDSLYRIYPDDLNAELIGSHGMQANFAQGMDFDDRDGQLYAWMHTDPGVNTLGTFNLETGAYTVLAQGQPGQWEGAIPGECTPMAIDPDALTGAWFSPYTSGQGFTIRYFPAQGQVFMPWFTFSVEGGDDDDTTRWYALYGEIAPDAEVSELEMPIVQVLGGSFDELPAQPQQIVGQAKMRFLSCNQGVLEYEFDPEHNEGVSGRLSLNRLLPLAAACSDFDGTIKEPEAVLEPSITGSWYDPATPGQGLELFRIAEDEEEDIAGLFYGAWFTFAPDNEELGPSGQRWLTLQGQLLDEDGILETSIAINPGGSFDNEPSAVAARIGSATIEVEACDQLLFAYEFNDDELAGEWRDLSGEITLRRLGPCPELPED